ncbi:hypothetical protein LINPERPRIM_LOCUS5677 [Linum perenne]
MNALKNLGLNVVEANVFLDASGKHNTFSITKAYVCLLQFFLCLKFSNQIVCLCSSMNDIRFWSRNQVLSLQWGLHLV